jgi:hypothetical protein
VLERHLARRIFSGRRDRLITISRQHGPVPENTWLRERLRRLHDAARCRRGRAA